MWVDQGQLIGLIDDTGENSFMSHLHFVAYARPLGMQRTAHADWRSQPQVINGDEITFGENGKCIKSRNRRQTDVDEDHIPNSFDNCIGVSNTNQRDIDSDGVGDVCDSDRDNDQIPNNQDSCPDNPDWLGLWDIDGDGRNDLTLDIDNDGIFNSCDPDIDGDGVANEVDVCAYGDDADDLDNDGIPDWCDFDADGDGYDIHGGGPAPAVGCPARADEFPMDPTRAGDHDGDGVDDLDDDCPCEDINPTCIVGAPINSFADLERLLLRDR